VIRYSRFDYAVLFAIRLAGVPGFSLPGAEWTRSRGEARCLGDHASAARAPVATRAENAPPSKLHRTLGIVPLRLLTMRLGERGPDTGFIRRRTQRRNGISRRRDPLREATGIVPCLPVGLTELSWTRLRLDAAFTFTSSDHSGRHSYKVEYGMAYPRLLECALKATRWTTNGNALGDGCAHRLKT
jgi:hypothetical protein